MTCLDVVMIVAELCRKRHNKVTKNAENTVGIRCLFFLSA